MNQQNEKINTIFSDTDLKIEFVNITKHHSAGPSDLVKNWNVILTPSGSLCDLGKSFNFSRPLHLFLEELTKFLYSQLASYIFGYYTFMSIIVGVIFESADNYVLNIGITAPLAYKGCLFSLICVPLWLAIVQTMLIVNILNYCLKYLACIFQENTIFFSCEISSSLSVGNQFF